VKTEPHVELATATRVLFKHMNVEEVEGFDDPAIPARQETPRAPFASSVSSCDANTAFLSTVDEYR
jgi:hypothetical protein